MATAAVIDPSTGEEISQVPLGTADDVDIAVQRAHAAHEAKVWRSVPAPERGRILGRVAALVRERADDLARLEATNAGKPISAALGEVGAVARTFEYYAGACDKVTGDTIPASKDGTLLTWREPLGVCALITPWNFPMVIAGWKVAPALAMGNTVVLKPASATPLTALALGELCLEAGVPEGVVNVVTGPGRLAGEALVRHPLVRKVGFTGSTEVGAGIMRLAADDITRVSLELGGKSANLVFADADLDEAVGSSIWSALDNAGQDCCARSRMFVQAPVYDEFVSRLSAAVQEIALGPTLDEATEMGPLISADQRESVERYLQIGLDEGAELLTGGERPDGALAGGTYLTPAVFAGAAPGSRLMTEEIFGPVIGVAPFETEEEAVALANDSIYGLSGSIWTLDARRALRMAHAVETGMLSVNSSSSAHIEAPFGGVKQSGLGREQGMAALEHYSELKTVFLAH
jgi:acyl-CoA reductase-like NAD-dependent aldehyde dehydrogenase